MKMFSHIHIENPENLIKPNYRRVMFVKEYLQINGFKIFLLALFLLVLHPILIFFTPLSFIGFWFDFFMIYFMTFFCLWVTILLNKRGTLKMRVAKIISVVNLCILGLFMNFLQINPYNFDHFKLTSFNFIVLEGRLFHAYFKPVGAYAGGEGQFWITESNLLIPFVEKEVFYDRTCMWDFGNLEFEGYPVNQNKIVETYIKEHVLKVK